MAADMLTQKEREIVLSYEDKESEASVIANTRPAHLSEVFKTRTSSLSTWRNMFVLGDNLNVLRTMLDMPDVKGQVQLVYIDPPFATGREFNGKDHHGPAYKDTLRGAQFLEFLRKRLILLRELLADDGSIYLHIDWKMAHYVRIIMDEVFKPQHFINEITRIKCNPKNFERSAYGNVKDTILFYSKNDEYLWCGARESMSEADIARLFPKVDKDGRHYTTTPLHAPGETENGPTGRPWKGMKPPKDRHWRYKPEKLTTLDNLGLIEWSSSKNPRLKIYADMARERGKKRQDIWEFKDPPYPRYPTEKNLDMLKTIIEASSTKDSLVLDCFAGSGSTLQAAEMLGRKWIGIDNSKTAFRMIQERFEEYGKEKQLAYPHVFYQASV
jgi:adenine-specific DNA-methyltransferase